MPQTSSTITSKGPEAHSAVVGGSTADRRLNCTASYRYEQMVPEHLKNQSSSYADEGTALHACMQYILEHDLTEDDLPTHILGRQFGDTTPITICQQLIDTAIIPCMDFIDALIEELADEGDFLMELEKRCEMPGIPEAFGTADIIFRTDKRSGVIDWKFGAGVAVKAEYPSAVEGEPPLGNSQLMYYGRAAQHTFPSMFSDDPNWPVDLYIVQPRTREGSPISKHSTTVEQLEEFRLDLIAAINEATETGGTCRRGDWCKFAACKAVCPLHIGPLLDTTKLAAITRRVKEEEPNARPSDALKQAVDETLPDLDADWSIRFAYLLDMAVVARETADEIFKLAQSHAEQGLRIRYDLDAGDDAWKLVPKRATESYVDEAGAVRHAIGLGVAEDDVYGPRPVKSPAKMAEVLEPLIDKTEFKTKKDRIAEARRQLREYTASVSSGSTLVRGTDARPALISSAEAVNSVASKLALIKRQ